MKLPEPQIELIDTLYRVNQNIIVVLSAGSAIEMPWIDSCKAILHAYLCGQAGASAVLDAIIGKVNPSGKLNETYPLRYEDIPSSHYFPAKERNIEYREGLYVGYRYFDTVSKKVLFPFGYGLSYTTFKYENLRIEDNKVIFKITNVGKYDGAEVAELYISAKNSKIYRPKKELKGFAKVFLKVGEKKEVVIELDDKAFRYFNIKTNNWEIEQSKSQAK